MKNEKVVLHSLEELRKYKGLKPAWVKTKNNELLESQRKKIAGKCRICGAPLIHVSGTNVFYCSNNECNGRVKEELIDIDEETGEEIKKTRKDQFIRLSNKEVANIANNLD